MADWTSEALRRIRDEQPRVAVLGCGYVGLTVALECARAGMRVVGVEADEVRAKDLRAGSNPVPDVHIPDGELDALRSSGNLTFAVALEGPADVYVICVNTPLKDQSPDLRYVTSAGEAVTSHLSRGALVILESTTYPGTTEELLRPILEEAGELTAGEDFALAFSPERIDPGSERWNHANTPKVVGGLTSDCTELASAFYARFCDTVVPVSSPRTAEITKLYENTYREVNIALANEMAMACRDFDIDPWEVLEAASTKPFGFTPFRPGPGVGGHCIGVDPQYLGWRIRGQHGWQFRLHETAMDINQRMPAYVVQRAAEILNVEGKALRGAHVLVLGVAYKGGSGDVRESPALRVADRLTTAGAVLTYHDPHVPQASIDGVLRDSIDLTDDVLRNCDLVVILADHPDLDYERVVETARAVFDTRGVTAGFGPREHVYRV